MTPAEIEAATPGDERRVLEALWHQIVPTKTFAWFKANVTRFTQLIDAEAYLDAAMMLVPEGAHQIVGGVRFSVECWAERGSYVHPPHVRATAWVPGAERTYAATPALALCAAIARGIE